MEDRIDIGLFKLFANRSLEKPPIRPGDAVFVLIHRLFVFDDAAACAFENGLISRKTGEGGI